jgi:hypothetical protein
MAKVPPPGAGRFCFDGFNMRQAAILNSHF